MLGEQGFDVTGQQWVFIEPLLPPPAHTGRPRANDRRTVDGILYILIIGCRWQDLPREDGAPTTVWRRLKRWGEERVWERIWRAALAALDQHGQLGVSISNPAFCTLSVLYRDNKC